MQISTFAESLLLIGDLYYILHSTQKVCDCFKLNTRSKFNESDVFTLLRYVTELGAGVCQIWLNLLR